MLGATTVTQNSGDKQQLQQHITLRLSHSFQMMTHCNYEWEWEILMLIIIGRSLC